ncbi:metallophosphoesterase [Tenacibaculum sp. UWU-22]|uniref:metallophosphoesterase n=1 Tax=Tenacibaculum sp. UWU-22 TaxID=3234187 RepID=UPI0034DB74D9
MKYYSIKIISLLFLTIIIYGCKKTEIKKYNSENEMYFTTKLNEIDGPYIYDKKDNWGVVTVEKDKNASFYIHNILVKKENTNTFTCKVNNSDNDTFTFQIQKEYKISKAIYPAAEKIFVTSDIEGNFNAFYSMLIGNNIIDKNYNWIFGNGHLVIAGDMVDRGNNAWPCLWLLYKLEQEAEKVGGKVHYILGNHDIMNMHYNTKYVKKRYIELAKIISGKENEKEAYAYLLSNTNEIAKWIATKNTIEKIGDVLYTHGGISIDMVNANLTIDQINEIVRKNIRNNLTQNPGDNKIDNLVYSRTGPFWYRGLVKDYKQYYKKVTESDLDKILKFYTIKHIVIGHTIVDEKVTSDFNGKVIRVDIKHPSNKFTGKSQGLLIENNQFFTVNDDGKKKDLAF